MGGYNLEVNVKSVNLCWSKSLNYLKKGVTNMTEKTLKEITKEENNAN